MKNVFLICLLFTFMMACTGESKKAETSKESPVSESTEQMGEDSTPKIDAVESAIDELDQKADELNNDLDSLINEI